MTKKEMKRRGLPEKCECGGKMEYDVSFGRVWSCCKKCSPVVRIDVDKLRQKNQDRVVQG